MKKFEKNVSFGDKKLIPCENAYDAIQEVDIITTAINEKKKTHVVQYNWLKEHSSLFINAIGGDCPGKTELDPAILQNSRIVLEYYPQTKIEGEIQNLEEEPEYTELWELIQNKKPGREEKDNIIVFDSVGFALADFSIMKLAYEKGLGTEIDFLPDPNHPKDLYGWMKDLGKLAS